MARSAATNTTQPITYPTGVKIIARRNKHKHFCVPRKDTTLCGIIQERVMFNSGCNTILLPFPEDKKRLETLQPFNTCIIDGLSAGQVRQVEFTAHV